ncbi:Hermansky-Pudlak syndrome 1 protein like protein [Gryllus bimaculatus]|nr:Hermansky-Pudlak syndrome 1 protein like protein [Gryllus bimaculatus]
MKCIIIFDQLNDILYTKYDRKFTRHMRKLGIDQGLISEDKFDVLQDEEELSYNVLIQIFSPVVASQRIMGCQFGNSYSSFQCEDGTNMVLDEFMGYLFIHIGVEEVSWLKRMLGICITIVKHLCGPDVSILKTNKSRAALLSRILDTWIQLQDSDQAVLVEAVEQLMVNTDLSAATLRALQEATEKLKSHTDFSRVHAMILVENKFLSLFSSRGTQDLTASDIMFLSLLCEAFHLLPSADSMNLVESSESEDAGAAGGESSSEEFYSPQASPRNSPAPQRRGPSQSVEQVQGDGLNSQLVLLTGTNAAFTPHVVHISSLEDGVFFLLMFETSSAAISAGLYEAFNALTIIQNIQLQRDMDGLKHAFEYLDAGVKKIFDGHKKTKNSRNEVESCIKKLQSQWESMRKKYIEYIKTGELNCIVRVESVTTSFTDHLKDLLRYTCWDTTMTNHGRDSVLAVTSFVKYKLADFSNFLKGAPMKPKDFPRHMLSGLPIPGILCGDFYQKLIEICFPKLSPSKVRCYELYCIHLGLATASCVLEHSRRLAATIWDVTGMPNNPIDLL